jgi:hypothetical protein
MKWIKASDYHIKSEDGKYIVNKAYVNGVVQYQAVQVNGLVSLLIAETADECKAKCEGVA